MARIPKRKAPPPTHRAFGALLRLYPPGFRDEYGRELALVFADRYRDAPGAGARARLWLEAVAGVLADAPRERARMLVHDVRHAWRALRRDALVTGTVVVTLAVGIGANTAIFSVVNAVVLHTVPVPHAGELYNVNGGGYTGLGPERARLSGPMFDRLRQAAPPGIGVAAMSRGVARAHTRVGAEAGTSTARLQLVSGEYFGVLGVEPRLGRGFTGSPGGGHEDAQAAVISDTYWRRRFGASPDAIGRTLAINGALFTVVGVGPPGYAGTWLELPVDIWVPLTAQSAVHYSQDFSADGADFGRPWRSQDRIWWLHVVTRAPQGREVEVEGAFTAAMSDLAGRRLEIVLEPIASGFSKLRQQFSLPLLALAAMAALVLLIACANVANLLLARAAGRHREMGVRMALGAGRGRLVQQLLAEGALMVALAAGAALVLARWTSGLLVHMATAASDFAAPLHAPIDLRVLAFTAVLALGTMLLFGLFPAWRATRLDVLDALRTGTGGSVSGARPARALVVLQVALSLVLVAGTFLLVQSFRTLLAVDPGFDRARLLAVAIDPRLSGVAPEAWPQLNDRLLAAVRALPGVQSASLAHCGLQSACRARESGFVIEGYQPRRDEEVGFLVNPVSPEYFHTVGMRLIAGRSFTNRDTSAAPAVAVVTRTLAAAYFPGGRAVGRRFGMTGLDVEIVGVVDDVRAVTLADAPPPMAFFPLAQRPVAARALDVRTAGAPETAAAAVRRALASAAPDVPVESIMSMDERVHRGLSQTRLVVLLTSGFGGVALGLAGFGLFGVLSYAVATRTRELGVRMALGASPARVVRGVVGDGLWLVLGGVLLGLPFVLLAGRLAATLVSGIGAHDAPAIAAAAGTLFAVGAACGLGPALRASRVDPMETLRAE